MKQDSDCVFCKIASGAIPCAGVLEDNAALAFLDVGPLAEGHLLLIPREHYHTLDEMPAAVAGAVLRHLPDLLRAVRQATGCEGFNVLQNNGRVAEQVVPHVHFHIIPRNPRDEFHFNWPAGSYPSGCMEELAGRIKAAL